MQDEQSAIALLLFRVGPVLCCAPADPIQTIVAPPKLTHPPGSSPARPGIFYHAHHVISVSDLRHRFGVPEADRIQPGRMIITLQEAGFIAYWVDEIVEVIDTPKEGWSDLPSHLPRGVFSKTLLLKEKIHLFADFGRFENLPECDYLSQYIDRLNGKLPLEEREEETPGSVAEPAAMSPADTESGPGDATGSGDKPPAEAADAAMEIPAPPPPEESRPPEIQVVNEPAQADVPADKKPLQDATPDSIDHDKAVDTLRADRPPEHVHDRPGHGKAIPPGVDQPEPVSHATELDPEATAPLDNTAAERPPVHDTDTPSAAAESDGRENHQDDAPPPARAKGDYLKPVPAVVPESEREPARPPFPWKNLAAAVVLFITLAGVGVYYLRTAADKPPAYARPDPARIEQAPNNVAQERTIPAVKPAAISAGPSPSQRGIPRATAAGKGQAAAPARPQLNQYHAEIKPDKHGVTIVLHSPEDEPQLKTDEPPPSPVPGGKGTKSTGPVERKASARPAKEEIIHIVVKGDTLWAIAEHYVKDPYKYPKLAELSKIRDPDRIYPGNRVRILHRMQKTE